MKLHKYNLHNNFNFNRWNLSTARNGKISEPERYTLLLNTRKKYIFNISRHIDNTYYIHIKITIFASK